MEVAAVKYGLTVSQLESVIEFSTRIADLNHPKCTCTLTLIRWLTSRSWNQVEAEKAFREHIAWRENNKIDTILSWYQLSDVIKTNVPGSVCGPDEYGRPLIIAHVGYYQPRLVMQHASRIEIINSRLYQFEYILQKLLPLTWKKEAPIRIDQVFLLLDMDGLGMSHMSASWLSMMVEALKTIEFNYPEVLSACFVVNAPRIFAYLYRIVIPLLSKRTQEKIHVLSSDFQELLLSHFDASTLPPEYGGTMTEAGGDPCTLACSRRVGLIPEIFFSQANNNDNTDELSDDFHHFGHVHELSCIEGVHRSRCTKSGVRVCKTRRGNNYEPKVSPLDDLLETDETTPEQSKLKFTHSDEFQTTKSKDPESHCFSETGVSVFPVPLDRRGIQPTLITGGNMDVDISLLFRLMAGLFLTPSSRSSGCRGLARP